MTTTAQYLVQYMKLLDMCAEAAWQQDSVRAAGKRRNISWDDVLENEKKKWRGLAQAVIDVVINDKNSLP